jgi:hypothetical protein
MGLALLALGLIRPWGEAVPGWIPILGGRRVPPLAAVLPAGMAAVLTVLTVAGAAGWSREFDVAGSPTGAAVLLMTVTYAPLLAWGPLLGVTTVACHRRRRSTSTSSIPSPPVGQGCNGCGCWLDLVAWLLILPGDSSSGGRSAASWRRCWRSSFSTSSSSALARPPGH